MYLDQNLFFYRNHPIQYVSVMGVIVTREEYERRTVLNVDDSSGAILEVVVLKTNAPVPGGGGGETEKKPKDQSSTTHVNITSATRTLVDIHELQIGAVVKVKGTLSRFRSIMQVQLERFWIVRDTNTQVAFWNDRTRFLVDVLSTPWSLDESQIAALRQRASYEEDRAVTERKRALERKRRHEHREDKHYRQIMKRWDKEEAIRAREVERVLECNRKLMARLAQRRKR